MPKQLFLVFLLFVSSLLTAQDLHFSQFYHNPLNLNPASTGVFTGTMRAAALYRSQWESVPVAYRTFSGAFDWKVLQRGTNNISIGGLLQHDKAGDGGLTWNQVGVSAAVAHALGSEHAISVGFGLAAVQHAVDLSGLTFKNQWSGDLFNPSLPTGETLAASSGLHLSVAAGIYYYFKSGDSRTMIRGGIGMLHLNRPSVNFAANETFKLPGRITFGGDAAWQVGQWTDAVLFAVHQRMGTAKETIAGLGARRWLTSDIAVQASLATRLGDAIIPAVQLEYYNWTVGLSYDWNTSDFNVATRGKGGVELAVVYRNLPPPPPKTFKSCPIF